MSGWKLRSVTTSARRPRSRSTASQNSTKVKPPWPGSYSTRRSRSLSGRACPRASEPKKIVVVLQTGYAADFILGLTVESLNGVRNRPTEGIVAGLAVSPDGTRIFAGRLPIVFVQS